MTTTPNGQPMLPLPLTLPDKRRGAAGALVIAAGTPYELIVRDARSLYRWATSSLDRPISFPRRLFYHHTGAGAVAKLSARSELHRLAEMAFASEWGLPYNFMVMPAPPFRIYYLNDVDHCYPHTLGHNCDTAVAAYGNFSVTKPDERMVRRMLAVGDALATMWGVWVDEWQHRDVMATECPGNLLSPLLPSRDRPR